LHECRHLSRQKTNGLSSPNVYSTLQKQTNWQGPTPSLKQKHRSASKISPDATGRPDLAVGHVSGAVSRLGALNRRDVRIDRIRFLLAACPRCGK
jgi:hypothetical protein